MAGVHQQGRYWGVVGVLPGAAVPADGPGVAVLVAWGASVLYRGAWGRAVVEFAVPLAADNASTPFLSWRATT